MISEGSCD